MSRPGFALGAEKKDGKLSLDSEQRYRALLARLRDGRYTVTIEREVQSRSGKANAAYWATIVTPISEHTGYEPDEVHELLKRFCNPKVVTVTDKETGVVEEVTIGGSTASMTNEEFTIYFKRCQQFAAEKLDCYCPDPDPEFSFNRKDDAA